MEAKKDGLMFPSGESGCGGGNKERRTPTGHFGNYNSKELWQEKGGFAHRNVVDKQFGA